MNEQGRPAANAFPGSRAATPAQSRGGVPQPPGPGKRPQQPPAQQPQAPRRPQHPPAQQPQAPKRPQQPPAQQPQPAKRPQQPQAPLPQPAKRPPAQQPQPAKGPQRPPAALPQPASRPQSPQRPQVAAPERPVQRPQQQPTPPRPHTPASSAPRSPQAAPAAVSTPQRQAAPEQVGPPPRPRKSKIGRWVALLVIAGGAGGAVWYATHTTPTTQGVGDCLAQTRGDQLVKVGCNDESARFQVVGKLEDRTVLDATLDACKAFPTATSAYWEGDTGQRGLVLCLEPVTPAEPPK